MITKLIKLNTSLENFRYYIIAQYRYFRKKKTIFDMYWKIDTDIDAAGLGTLV